MDRGVWQATVQGSPEIALSDPQTPAFTFLLLFWGRGGVVSTGDRRAALGLNLAGKPVPPNLLRGGRAGEGLAEQLVPVPAPGLRHPPVVAGEEADPEMQPPSMGEVEPQTPPAQVGGRGPRLLSRPGADSGRGAPLPEAASCAGPGKAAGGARVTGTPRSLSHLLPS